MCCSGYLFNNRAALRAAHLKIFTILFVRNGIDFRTEKYSLMFTHDFNRFSCTRSAFTASTHDFVLIDGVTYLHSVTKLNCFVCISKGLFPSLSNSVIYKRKADAPNIYIS